MNWAINYEEQRPQTIWYWLLALTLPILMAADIAEHSRTGPFLPEKQSYRSNLSDIVIESSGWREKKQETIDWRNPRSPEIKWRTEPRVTSQESTTRKRLQLFPAYRPGETSAFDFEEREDKSLIKIFEFGH
ncbi:MAG: hypothetical protein GKS05_11625 [Nitrospirales bacterium]|nr:hypothetical protein [Nitrospirales bacterium]